MIAHTIVVGANSDNKVTDKRANCFLAAHYASQAALRLMRPGNDVCIIFNNFKIYLVLLFNSLFIQVAMFDY